MIAEALVIVREGHHRQISEVLERFDSTYGIRLKFSYYSIKDGSEDIGTADALREAATRNLIKVGVRPHAHPLKMISSFCCLN
jgi:hypothetical protein